MVFVAVEADYFPRLSSVNNDVVRMNRTINQQIDVCLMLMTPILIAFILALPVVIPLLLRDEFLAIVPMCTWASFYMFLRSIVVPLEYTALAKGDSKMYLVMEVFYDVLCVLLMRYMFDTYGLVGAGIALSLAVSVNLLVVYVIYHLRYGCQLSLRTLRLTLIQLVCLTTVVAICFLADNLWIRYAFGTLVFLLSACFSFRLLNKESNLVARLVNKLRHNDHCDCC